MSNLEEKKQEYSRYQDELDNLQEMVQKRDTMYLDIASEIGGDTFNDKRKQFYIDTKLNNLIKERENVGNYLSKLLSSKKDTMEQLEIREIKLQEYINNKNQQKDKVKIKSNTKNNYNNILKRNIEVLKREMYIYDETIHLLYILLVFLVIASLILLLYFKLIIDKYITIALISVLLLFYILYVLKITYVDRVNINNYDYRKYDYNKPADGEIITGEQKNRQAKTFNYQQNECKNNQENIEYKRYQKDSHNKIFNEVKNDVESEIDKSRCLITHVQN